MVGLDSLRGRKNNIHAPFVHDWLKMPVAVREEVGEKRFYRTPEGNLYPSVTTFLGAFEDDPEWFERWAKKLGGIDKANAESQRCCDRGTAVHKALEEMILNRPDPHVHAGIYRNMFFQLANVMRKYLSKVCCLETPLYSDKLMLAGTVDCAGIFDGMMSVVDFKTANDLKRIDWIEDYFLQATAYALMLEHHFNIEVPQIVIAIAVEKEERPQIIRRMKHEYEKTLWKKVEEFHKMPDWYPEAPAPSGSLLGFFS